MRKTARLAAFAAMTATAALLAAAVLQAPASAAGTTPVTMTASAPKTIANGGTVTVTGSIGVTLAASEPLTVSRTTRLGTTDVTGDIEAGTDGTFSFSDAPGTTGPVSYTVTYAGDDTYEQSSVNVSTYERPLAYDFNGDGFAEAVSGSDGEDIGSATNAGSFYVFPSSSAGVSTTGSKAYSQGSGGLAGTAEKNDYFGLTEASGDFNGDGFADLAVSAPDETIDGNADVGGVTVLFGSASGLTTAGSFAVYGSKTKGGFFGISLAAGDFDGDGHAELAVGADELDAVYVYHGMAPGHAGTYTKFVQGAGGVPGGAMVSGESYRTRFGENLSTGDVNGDGIDELAVGAPYDWEQTDYSSGSVTILYGHASGGLSTSGVQYFTLNSANVAGKPTSFGTDQPDDWGWQTHLGDVNGDGKADLVVGSPGTDITNASGKHVDAGAVSVLFASGTKITGTGSLKLTQDTSGIAGSPGKNDGWGDTIATGDLNGDGKAEIVATGEDRYVDVIPGSSTGPVTSKTTAWTQASPNIVGTDTAGDEWGESLQITNFKGAGPADLLVGAPGKHDGEGSITVMYSSSAGVTGSGSLYIDQNTSGVPGTAEAGDWMGTFF